MIINLENDQAKIELADSVLERLQQGLQAVGAIPVDVKELGVDMLSMSAHKFNGPKGMGALYCKKGVWPQNLIDGGSQEARHRAGTENVAGIAGMGKALEMATANLEERMSHEQQLRDYVINRILKNIPEARLNGGLEHRLRPAWLPVPS